MNPGPRSEAGSSPTGPDFSTFPSEFSGFAKHSHTSFYSLCLGQSDAESYISPKLQNEIPVVSHSTKQSDSCLVHTALILVWGKVKYKLTQICTSIKH